MKSKTAKMASIAMALVLMLTLALMAGCAAGVSQEEYDKVVAERDALSAQVTELESELAVVPTPEELFETIAEDLFNRCPGDWTWEMTMTVGAQTMELSGTMAMTLTGPTSADFVNEYVWGGEEMVEEGEMWWDAEKSKLAMMEAGETNYYYLTANGFEGKYEMDGMPEFGITERVFVEHDWTFVDSNTLTWVATVENTEGDVLMGWESEFIRAAE
jgi:hypothetical protein